jgi:small-conductance mechanosensitive channel
MRLFFHSTIVGVILAFAVAAIAARIFRAVIYRKLDALDSGGAEGRAALHARATGLIWTLTLLAFGVAALAAMSFAFRHFGISEPEWYPDRILHRFLTHGVPIVFIIVGAMVVVRAAHLAIEHLQHQLGRSHARTDHEWQRRASTLAGILSRLVTVSISFIAILMLLLQLQIDVLPILTSAGIAGLAVGFGAQNLVRDVISGFFLILEDQVRIGDSARINGVSGSVEQINLRTIVLRDVEGAVQVFPNGTITALANLSKQFAFAVVDVRVSYREDIDRVLQAIHEVGAGMQQDPDWRDSLLGAIDVVGVESMTDRFVVVRMRFKTRPLKQGPVGNELRRRIMVAFAARKIRPFG